MADEAAVMHIGELEDVRAVLNTLISAAGEGLIAINTKNIIVMANEALESMWGYEPGELLGKPVQILMPLHYRKDHTLGVRNFVMENKRDTSGHWNDVEALHKKGHEFPVHIRIRRVQHEGEFLLVAAVRDVTLYHALSQSAESALAMAQMGADKEVLVTEIQRLRDEIERLNEAEGHMGEE